MRTLALALALTLSRALPLTQTQPEPCPYPQAGAANPRRDDAMVAASRLGGGRCGPARGIGRRAVRRLEPARSR